MAVALRERLSLTINVRSCAFDLPAERFSFFALTDGANVYRERQTLTLGGEQLDRVPVAAGDIFIADRGFMHPDQLARVHEQGADFVVRAGWAEKASRSICWPLSPPPQTQAFSTVPFGSTARKRRRWRCA